CQFTVRRRRGFAERKRRRRFANQRGRVGHHANDPRVGGQRRLHFGKRHPGGDRNQQMFVREIAALFGQNPGYLVGFHGENKDVRELQNVGAGRGGLGAGFLGEGGARRLGQIAGDDFFWENNFRANEA